MTQIQSLFSRMLTYFELIRITDILDILIVAFIIYKLLSLITNTNSKRVAKGLLIIIIFLLISDLLNLTVIHYLLSKTVEVGLIALVVLFQPEIRHFLERVGSGKVLTFLRGNVQNLVADSAIAQTVLACTDMSKTKTGALIIFERVHALDDQINTGTIVDSETTSELLKNIFFNKAPLHDGAVIIRDGRIAAAGCMLPLSGNSNLSRDLGMRHRAGIGMSEHSDAVVAIVSEETGAISIAVDGMLKRHLTPETFEKLLRNELITDDMDIKNQKNRVLSKFMRSDNER